MVPVKALPSHDRHNDRESLGGRDFRSNSSRFRRQTSRVHTALQVRLAVAVVMTEGRTQKLLAFYMHIQDE
ncbi:UNVERIFIED_CONTAM: hypothetical protein FKN15_050934 [Acipenser sinensis]